MNEHSIRTSKLQQTQEPIVPSPVVAGFLIWTFVGLIFVAQAHINVAYMGKINVPIESTLAWELSGWWLWGLLSPLVAWFTYRFPIERPRLARDTGMHLLAALGFATVHTAVHYQLLVGFDAWFAWTGEHSLARDFVFGLITRFSWRLLVYFVLVIIFRAIYIQKKLREEERRAARLHVQLAQSQLQALKMQLHPHFLFNTLQSISELMHEDLPAADRMIEKLGEFLRLTLQSSSNQQISLKEELHFLKCYLEIEQVRFRDRLQTIIDVGPEAMEAYVPNLILQPLVENAIRHGIAPQAETGRIEIHAHRYDGKLQMQVRDTGKGLNLQDNSDYFEKGVGLSNTRARLEQLYGSNFHISIENAGDGGLQVSLEIPFRATKGGQ